MSAKVNHGINWVGNRTRRDVDFLLLRPESGGWLLNSKLQGIYEVLERPEMGWGWSEVYDRQYGGASLVAPLTILYWGKEDES